MKFKMYSILIVSTLGLHAFAQPALTIREEKLGYTSVVDAKSACLQAAEDYLKKYEAVTCEPTLKTNVRTLHWNTVVTDQVYAGKTTNVQARAQSSLSAGVTSFFGEVLNWRTRFVEASASSSYQKQETPVYSTIYKTLPQQRDEVVETYGYRILTSVTEAVLKVTGDSSLQYQSGNRYDSEKTAAEDCDEYKTVLSGFRIVGDCIIQAAHHGTYVWNFNGQNNSKK